MKKILILVYSAFIIIMFANYLYYKNLYQKQIDEGAKTVVGVNRYADEEYPDIKDVRSNITLIENEGFNLLGHFTLPTSSWTDTYYKPMEKKIQELKEKYHDNDVALHVFRDCEKEIRIYKKYSDFYGYEFFIMQKT